MFTSNVAAPLKILVAGSTNHTLELIEALAKDTKFTITGVLTPAAKPIGRTQTLTPNPVETWAKSQQLPVISVFEKIDQTVQKNINEHKNSFGCDFLLIVDFGYFLPNWLLKIPEIAPVNVHPSKLPAWRGSSPGQRVLLAGETNSAVSVILVTAKMDQGDILTQLPVAVDQSWDAGAYYRAAFDLVAPKLAEILVEFAAGHIAPVPQPSSSPTPTAAKLTKVDSFVPWEWLVAACGWKI
jgi:methionyl-tRNA formyltransferase